MVSHDHKYGSSLTWDGHCIISRIEQYWQVCGSLCSAYLRCTFKYVIQCYTVYSEIGYQRIGLISPPALDARLGDTQCEITGEMKLPAVMRY